MCRSVGKSGGAGQRRETHWACHDDVEGGDGEVGEGVETKTSVARSEKRSEVAGPATLATSPRPMSRESPPCQD